MTLTIWQVDAFTDMPFSGNPAAVCVLPAPAADGWMQAVAREMNLSETAFLVARDDGFDLRWFTPAVEVDLCGHATLASAHVLFEQGLLEPATPARFHTRSGLLTARRRQGGIEMDFPTDPAAPTEAPPALLHALAVDSPRFSGRSRFDWLLEVASEEEVRALQPDMALLASIATRGVIVTAAAAGADCDFVSRFFAPAAGIPEDPVTGSSHCALGPFWAVRLGKRELRACQVSARGGVMLVRPEGERVFLTGNAVTVLRAELSAAASG